MSLAIRIILVRFSVPVCNRLGDHLLYQQIMQFTHIPILTGTFSGAPGELPGRRPDQATLRERPVGLVRSLLQIRQTLGPGDVDVEVLDVDVDLVRRRGRRLRSPDCPG